MSMYILVIGRNGQVGRELCALGGAGDLVVEGLGRDELDITREAEVARAIAARRPGLVVNAAAYTAVDKAEAEPELAFAVNASGAGAVARACSAIGAPLVHISTDYVFDGRKNGPYKEEDPVAPQSVYGRSKAAGEDAVRTGCAEHVILRTAWVFSPHGTNFVKTMLRLGEEREELRVVDDQRGCPTAARDIAGAIAGISRQILSGARDRPWGTYHYAGGEAVTWFGFAGAIFAERRAATGKAPPRLVPITTADYPTPARRPANSVLDCSKAAATFGIAPSDWRGALRTTVAELCDTHSRKVSRQ